MRLNAKGLQEVYRVTRLVNGYERIELATKRSVQAQITEQTMSGTGWGRRNQILKVERAPVGEFVDVSEEFLR